MRRFRFKLEAVRELREQAETSAQEALARELELGRACEEELSAADRRLDSARRDTAPRPGRAFEGAELRAREAFLRRRETELQNASRNVARQSERVEAGRLVLLDAARERQALERLKERRRDEHARAAGAAEGRHFDDLRGAQGRDTSPPSAA